MCVMFVIILINTITNLAVQTVPYEEWVNLLVLLAARIDLKFEKSFKMPYKFLQGINIWKKIGVELPLVYITRCNSTGFTLEQNFAH